MSASGAGEEAARRSLAEEMILGIARQQRPSSPDVDRKPEPEDRPDPRAQWDEVKGEWVIWDEDANEWEALDNDADHDTPDK